MISKSRWTATRVLRPDQRTPSRVLRHVRRRRLMTMAVFLLPDLGAQVSKSEHVHDPGLANRESAENGAFTPRSVGQHRGGIGGKASRNRTPWRRRGGRPGADSDDGSRQTLAAVLIGAGRLEVASGARDRTPCHVGDEYCDWGGSGLWARQGASKPSTRGQSENGS
jgi:hypothetical protein